MQNYKIILAAVCVLLYPAFSAYASAEEAVSEYGLFDYLGTLVADEDEWVDAMDMETLDITDPETSPDGVYIGDIAEETPMKVIKTEEMEHE